MIQLLLWSISKCYTNFYTLIIQSVSVGFVEFYGTIDDEKFNWDILSQLNFPIPRQNVPIFYVGYFVSSRVSFAGRSD